MVVEGDCEVPQGMCSNNFKVEVVSFMGEVVANWSSAASNVHNGNKEVFRPSTPLGKKKTAT